MMPEHSVSFWEELVPAIFRLFWGWEGCRSRSGSCEGNCAHVWNYAQTVANLFPVLERSMRETDFLWETKEDGEMIFRARMKLTGTPSEYYPAVDGQFGCVLRAYREWKMSGDDVFLRKIWNPLVRALEFGEKHWDSDGDFVLDGMQHNTYDIEFYGVQSLGNSTYFAALKAGAEMADYLGERELSAKWRKAFCIGSAKMDEVLFDGEYYRQVMVGDIDEYKYQYGDGCLSDQILGQVLAHLYGLGYVLPEEHVNYDGYKRSPFNEIECGNHYVRSMASWGVINAFSGLLVDLPNNRISIDPKVNQDNFSCFYVTGKEWGICRQVEQEEGTLKQWFEPMYFAE